MHLERIEISGFKSFADKTTIVFDKGVTAVVGPNGSGKSNLSEAIKWVLGEQSAKSLRGKKMDDIIFAGSQTRKPINVAEVTLVLNNEDRFLPLDFSQIQITRRLNRFGESECFINKQPCRLKDIVNLLMDSGLGKDSFSIISQGKVETIFQNKPEERRGMFEEVAGVLKYKTRKQEASRKLDKTQEHLDRVEDIIFEINNQLEPLLRQKEKAQIYLEKKQALSHIDVALMVAEIDASHAQLQLVNAQLDTLEQTFVQKEHEKTQLEQTIQQLRMQLTTTENDLNVYQQQFVTLVQRVETLHGEQKVLQERLQFSKQNKGQQDEALFEKQTLMTQLNEQIDVVKQDNQHKQQLLTTLEETVQHLQLEYDALTSHSKEKVEQLRQHYIEQLTQEATLQNDCTQANKQREQNQFRLQRLTEQLQMQQQTVEQLQQTIAHDSNAHAQLQQTLEQLTKTYDETQHQLQTVKHDKHAIDSKLQTVIQQHQLDSAKRNSLKELQEDYAGYYQGVREILKQKQTITGLHGALAEIIHVDTRYTTAIDIALGANLQHVVVQDEHVATKAIHYLKQKQLGRATFLPITVIQPRELPNDISRKVHTQDGFVGVASDLVQTEATYTKIISNLLGQTIVTETIQQATKIAKLLQYRYRIVTLDGEVLHAGGSMSGGFSKQKSGTLLQRQATLESLEQKITTQLQHIDALKIESQTFEEKIVTLQQTLQSLQQEGTAQRLQERELFVAMKQNRAQLDDSQRQAQVYNLDVQALQEEQNAIQDSYTTTVAKLEVVSKEVQNSRELLAQMNASQEEKAAKVSALQEQLQHELTQLAIVKEQLATQQTQLKQLEKQRADVSLSLQAVQMEQTETLQSRELLQEQLETVTHDCQMFVQKRDALNTQLNALKETKKDLDVSIVLNDTQLSQVQQALQSLLKEQGTYQSRQERYHVTIDTHLNRLSQEYEMTYEAAKTLAPLEMSISDASAFVSRVKREIEQLGPVNMAAITEYEATFERYTQMSEQQHDLIQAKEQLLNTMIEMDSEVEKRFSETFYAIKQQFEKTFPKLFGGGRATLELTDPTNILTSGVDIIAQPPGKRLQNLSLLSGGERAFTAIALLFAILEVKPVPFCLLDEVEAALDEANVGRYGRYLKAFTQTTQFIVITHRKGTMEEADVLYGVTMQESGVSKLASVKLSDYD